MVAEANVYQEVMRESAALHRANRFKDAVDLLLAYEADFAGDPDFDYRLGVSALESGQPALAQQVLERVVLVKPDFAGAWIDLALAHARLGEIPTALQIVEHVESSFNVPVPLHEQLTRLRAELHRLAEPRSRIADMLMAERRGYLQLTAGRDSNANLGLATSVLSLTPVGQPPIQMEVAPGSRARPDTFVQMRGNLQQTLQFGESNRGRLHLSGQYKDFSSLKDYNLGDLAASYAHEYALPQWRDWALEGTANLRGILIGGNRFATLSSTGLGVVRYANGCRFGARAGREWRDYGIAGYVDADVRLLTFSATCQSEGVQFGLLANVARDNPLGTRAGGQTDRQELGMHYALQLSPRLGVVLIGLVGQYRDSTGYSPLLENGAVRRITRTSARMEWLWQIYPDRPEWAIQVEVERLQDHSNLEIFNFRNTLGAIGLRYQY